MCDSVGLDLLIAWAVTWQRGRMRRHAVVWTSLCTAAQSLGQTDVSQSASRRVSSVAIPPGDQHLALNAGGMVREGSRDLQLIGSLRGVNLSQSWGSEVKCHLLVLFKMATVAAPGIV